MAIPFNVIGKVQKMNDEKGKTRGFGVLLELYFPDGQTRQYQYKARRKKDILADMYNGKMSEWINSAHINERGKLIFEIQRC